MALLSSNSNLLDNNTLGLKIKTRRIRKALADAIFEIHATFTDESLPERASTYKTILDSKLGRGWSVWCGKHLVGSCSVSPGTLAEFIDGDVSYTLYKS